MSNEGDECKELGDGCFLFTFHQAPVKRRALEDGAWMISKEVLDVIDFDSSKSLDKIDFSFVLIWIRIAQLTMGLLDKAAAMTIGDEIGEIHGGGI